MIDGLDFLLGRQRATTSQQLKQPFIKTCRLAIFDTVIVCSDIPYIDEDTLAEKILGPVVGIYRSHV